MSGSEDEIAAAIRALLSTRRPGATICPSEAARRVAPRDWRRLMQATRRVVAVMARRGEVVVTQRGQPVDPETATGPVRIGRAAP